jgi:hypothetical protein
MSKSCTWQAPLVVRRFKTPTGPLAEADPSMVYDFSKQRDILPHPIGARYHEQHTMNKGGMAAHADLTTPDTHGVESPFQFPK